MARKLKISAAVLNVRLHPHTSSKYADWIASIFSTKSMAQVHGDRYGMISLLDSSRSSDGIITGIITTFLKLEEGQPWFNSSELKKATSSEVQEINIPNNLYPNSSSFYFLFDTNKHKLYFQTYSAGKTFTPGSALKFFGILARRLVITKQFGEAIITIVQDKSSLDKMYNISKINKITISIMKPNADIWDDDFEEEIEEHLEKTGSKEIQISYKADINSSIQPDSSIKRASKLALDNGFVEVKGRDDKGAVSLNTRNFPKEYHDQYDPEIASEQSSFYRMLQMDILNERY